MTTPFIHAWTVGPASIPVLDGAGKQTTATWRTAFGIGGRYSQVTIMRPMMRRVPFFQLVGIDGPANENGRAA